MDWADMKIYEVEALRKEHQKLQTKIDEMHHILSQIKDFIIHDASEFGARHGQHNLEKVILSLVMAGLTAGSK